MSILKQVLKDTAARTRNGQRVLTIFDLDSTLFDLTLRMVRIVEEFADDPEWKRLYPSECAILKTLPILSIDWSLRAPLERAGLFEKDHADFYRDLHRFWAACFFSGDYLHHDVALPGALNYVREAQKRGADIMYLTGRDVPRMYEGTARILKDQGFPVDGPGVDIVLKPLPDMDDAQFKLDVIRNLTETYSKIWLFENEPVNLNLVAKHLPDVGLIFIDSCHSGKEELAPILDRIVHFEITMDDLGNP